MRTVRCSGRLGEGGVGACLGGVCLPEGSCLPRRVSAWGCLPRGCLPGGGGCLPSGLSAQSRCLPAGVYDCVGCLPGGVCLGGVCLRRAVSAWGGAQPPFGSRGRHSSLWTEFLTHACENITFLQLLLRTVMTWTWHGGVTFFDIPWTKHLIHL